MNDIFRLKELCTNRSVLYVEDEKDLRFTLGKYLEKLFEKVVLAADGEEGLQKYTEDDFDLVITDISMPKKDGMVMSKDIKNISQSQEIMIISAYSEPEYFLDAIRIGVDGFILKPVEFTQLNTELLKIMTKIEMVMTLEAYNSSLERLVEEKTKREHTLELEKIKNQKRVMVSLIELIEKRDSYTAGHSIRVANYCKIIAEKMGYDKSNCELIYEAGILHDIGKIGIPDTVLLKPGKFTDQEYQLIKQHVDVGVDVLKNIPMYKGIVDVISHHHERFDGSGYPHGIKGDEIPKLARIMIVADAFDAMTTNRIYKKKKSISEALDELKSLSGIQFHPEVVAVVVKALENIEIDDEISQMPQSELEKERFAYFYKDQITGAFNQTYLENILREYKVQEKRCDMYAVNLHGLGNYNKRYGWDNGDELLAEVSRYLNDKYKSSILFRVHGDRFILLNCLKSKLDLDDFDKIDFLNTHNIGIEISEVYSGKFKNDNIEKLMESIYN
ncbi:MAG: histidine kinase [Arcobacter sp.]|nr:MAG: histidine kinase [Arcobacter sp.]